MQSNTTQKNIRAFFRRGLTMLLLMVLVSGISLAQPYVNGNLITGTTSANGAVTAPTGFSLSELQPGILNFGFGANLDANPATAIADDFTIPAGQTWNITTLKLYAYSTAYAGATSPFDEVRVRIFNTDPSVGAPVPVFGDLTTNRLANSVSANIYRIGGNPVPPLNTQRLIWEVNANINTTLTAGTYWVEFQVSTIAGVTSNFMPHSTVVGTATQPGNNAKVHNVTANTWGALLDGTNPQDMPFVINYTTTCAGTPPTVTVAPTTGLCSPVTLTASGATDYTWSPAAGLNTTTGATVTAAPTATTTYTVTGVTAGCSGQTTVTVNAGPSSAVLSGVAPSTVLLNENFDGGVPATWVTTNNSDVIGTIPTWEQGDAGLFPPFNGAADSYVFGSFNNTAGTVISNWLLTNQITTISNGDVLSFYTRTTTPGAQVFPDRLEVRLSTAGASTNVGATPTSVGDFTTLLLAVNPDLTTTGYPSDWTRFEVTIAGLAAPASGRIGFRYWVIDAGPTGNNSDNIGLDQVRLETPIACTAPGATQTMNVAITGGTGPFTVVYNDGTANQTINNYVSGADIQVAPTTSTTYTLVSVTSADGCTSAQIGGTYSVNISAPPVVTTQPPATLSVCDGEGGTLSVVVPGTNTYQWQVSLDGGVTFNDITDNANYSGTTTSTLTLTAIPGAFNDYRYQVIVTNACGTPVTSTATTVTVTPAAVITTQPASVSACSGTDAVFTVVATGTGTISYQWEVSTDGGATWSALTGETSPTLTVTATTIGQNGYQYRVLVATCGTPAPSDAATLTVQESIVITTQPASIAACTGNTADFSVIATGSGNTYQWQESTDGGVTFNDIPGATAATYTTPAVTAGMDNYQYQVIVSNGCGAPVTSSAATLTITTAAAITGEPVDVTVCSGTAASFTVTATGATSYQWQVSTDGGTTFTDIAGETGATLNIPTPTGAINGYVYHVLVGSCGAPLTSANATITVNDVAAITTQPASTSACDGGDATFTVVATGTAVTYQWQVSTDGGTTFTDMAGETNATLTLNAVNATLNNYQYQVVLNNACTTGLVSTPATLTISSVATITSQPANSTVCDGTDASFTVVAGGATGYQWQVSTDGGVTFTDIAGATAATLDLTGVTTTDNNNQYQVAITSCGPTPVTSTPATLTVTPTGAITTQPASTSACDGGNATFTVVATGNALTYQWEISADGGATWTPIPGATSASVTSPVTAAMNNGQIRVVIGGDCTTGLTSDAAILTITPAAAITAQPVAVSGCEGSDAMFEVTATDATGYQWQVSTDGGTTFTDIAGETGSSLTLTGFDATANDNQYQVVVSNACGDVTSAPATLTVNAAPTVTVTADDTSVEVGVTATLTATATPATATYQWYVDGVAIPGATNATYAATTNTPGVYEYTVEVTGDGGCTVMSSITEITVTTTNFAFITPNANNGSFKVNFSNIGNVAVMRIITIYDTKGRLVYKQSFPVTPATNVEVMDVNVPLLPSGIYWLMLSESNGKRLKTEQLIIQK